MRWHRLLIAIPVGTVIVASMGAATPSTPSETRHASGIMILSGDEPEPDPLPEDVAQGLDMMAQESSQDPANLSYPYADATSKTVVATSATEDGQARATELTMTASRNSDPTVTYTAQPVQHSRQFLDRVMDEVIGRQPEGFTVIASYPDPKHNRIVAEVDKLDDAFLYRLAGTYGDTAIAVRVTQEDAGTPASREADTSWFWGGANVDGCTTGFAWHSGLSEMMVTAGHCFPNGASSVSTPAEIMGSIRSGYEESYNNGTGTVLMTGQSTYRGDIALIRLFSGKHSDSYIYRGGYNSSSHSPVAGKWSRSPALGDQYCTGGRNSGEQCGWKVKWSAPGNYTYKNGDVLRRVWRGDKRGWCIKGGDSGGPVYTVRSDGYVVAKGIISGATGFGGSDAYAGALDTPCRNIFTDIWDAYYGLPGDIN